MAMFWKVHVGPAVVAHACNPCCWRLERETRAAESDLDSEGKMDWGYSLVVVHLPSVTGLVQALGTAEEDQ